MIPSSNVSYTFPATGAVARTVEDKLGEAVSVEDFGAVGDGITNDTGAFQAACDYAHSVGYDVTIPNKRFLIDPIIVRGGVVLRGTTPGPFDSVNADGTIPGIAAYPKGPTLLVNSAGSVPFIQLDGYGSSVKHVIIYYPQQAPVTASTPNAYPFTIAAGASGAGLIPGPGHFIEGVTLINSYNGISLQSGRSAIRNCFIGAFNIGIYLDNIFDYAFLENIVHQVLWDTWTNVSTPQPIDQWVMDHGVAFQFGRVDGFFLNNVGIFMRNIGFAFYDGAEGAAYGLAQNIDIDSVVYGVVCKSSNNGVSTKFNNTVIDGASMTGTVTAQGVAAVLAQSGGVYAPNIKWNGGTARGTWSSGPIAINAGNVQCRNVGGVNETGPAAFIPPIPSSGAAYLVPGATPRMVTISGGTVTQIAISGVNTGLSSGAFYLIPGETITITYSTAPTWKWFVR